MSKKMLEGSSAEENSESVAVEAGEDENNKVIGEKRTTPAVVQHKPGCGAVGHAGACKVTN